MASNGGLHRFFQGAWVENGIEEGLPSAAVREIYEDQRGLWAGTTHGLSLYHPEADPDPPQTRIQELKDSEKNVPEGGTITITFSGQDKWKYTPRERLLYSGRLDEHEWTPFEGVNGAFFQFIRTFKAIAVPNTVRDPKVRRRLWTLSERLVAKPASAGRAIGPIA